jgi:hypothetical protein
MRTIKVRGVLILLLCLALHQGVSATQDPGQDQSDLDTYLHSTNPHLREHAYELKGAKWPGQHVFVCWENPSPDFQNGMHLVQEEVQETWVAHSQLMVTGWEKCAAKNKGIHILIDDSGPHTQYLGRQLDGLKNGMVLNFTFLSWGPQCQQTLDYCIKGIAGHEFGHAIGFAHENDRPDKPPNRPGECLPTKDQKGDTMLTPYDEHSIMNYCNSKYNNDGKLSALDIDAVQKLYGAPRPTQGKLSSPERNWARLDTVLNEPNGL